MFHGVQVRLCGCNAPATAEVYTATGRTTADRCLLEAHSKENNASVAYRYDETPDPTFPFDEQLVRRAMAWLRTLMDGPARPGLAFLATYAKALSCFEYQACEHPGWADSEAHGALVALREGMLARVKGYADAAWSIYDIPAPVAA